MPKRLSATAALLLAGCATLPAERYDLTRATVDRVTETERRFAADFQQARFQSFVDYAAEDAVTANETGYESARPGYAELAARPVPPNAPKLEWWPAHVEASCAGDIAWSTGPVLRTRGDQVGHAHYFTIWERQADGSYKWKFDRGTNHGAPDKPFPRGAEPETNSRSYCAELSAKTRMAQAASFARAEADFQRRLASDAAAAYREVLHPAGWIARENELPRTDAASSRTLLVTGPQAVSAGEVGSRVSASGDVAYSYGKAAWRDGEGAEHKGDYVRIWRNEGRGWKIVFDQLNEAQG